MGPRGRLRPKGTKVDSQKRAVDMVVEEVAVVADMVLEVVHLTVDVRVHTVEVDTVEVAAADITADVEVVEEEEDSAEVEVVVDMEAAVMEENQDTVCADRFFWSQIICIKSNILFPRTSAAKFALRRNRRTHCRNTAEVSSLSQLSLVLFTDLRP